MQKLIINIWKIVIKNKESSYLKYWDVNNQYWWPVSQKLPINGFKWTEVLSEFDEGFIKNYKKSKEGDIFKTNIQYREELHELVNDLPFTKTCN